MTGFAYAMTNNQFVLALFTGSVVLISLLGAIMTEENHGK